MVLLFVVCVCGGVWGFQCLWVAGFGVLLGFVCGLQRILGCLCLTPICFGASQLLCLCASGLLWVGLGFVVWFGFDVLTAGLGGLCGVDLWCLVVRAYGLFCLVVVVASFGWWFAADFLALCFGWCNTSLNVFVRDCGF